MRTFLLICLALLVLAACSPVPVQPPPGTGIEGQVFIGPACPVVQVGEPCPDQPYQATLVVLDTQGREVTRFQTDVDEKFRVTLGPGTYTLAPESANAMQHASRQDFNVVTGQYTRLRVTYDSGIR